MSSTSIKDVGDGAITLYWFQQTFAIELFCLNVDFGIIKLIMPQAYQKVIFWRNIFMIKV